ncbi:hypothetical protein FRC02_002348 [Tulasnella sp. 418]|nr:hypothetical protein FRC02_002348 [Tulasnella sp. 418]
MSHKINIDTTQRDVSSVCLFQQNRAEVTRHIDVELQTGQNEVIIERLPNVLDKDSIRVDGTGNAVIFDVIYSPPPYTDPSASNHEHSEAYKALRDKENALWYLKDALKQQEDTLDQYSNSLTADKADINSLTSFLDIYLDKKAAIHEKRSKISDELLVLAKQIGEMENKMHVASGNMKRTVKITVIVLAEKQGKAELKLEYVVTNAFWTPLYDIRAKGSDSKESSRVSLSYRASISQQTGEDWNNIDLTLSTASPLLGSDIPTLQPYRVRLQRSFADEQKERAQRKRRTRSYGTNMELSMPQVIRVGSVVERGRDRNRGSPRSRSSSITPPPIIIQAPMQVPTAVPVAGTVNATFMIEGKSTIPSDSDADPKTHKVSIAVIDLQAKLEWIAIPKVKPAAFLQCQLKNTSQYVLLPGSSNVFMDDNFICKSSIPNVSPQESFSTSLGVDSSVKITYHPVQKKTKLSKGSVLGPKSDVTSFIQNITIKNTRGGKVDKLIVKEPVPISEESTLKVAVIEPKDLGSAKDRKEVNISREIKARWSFKGDGNIDDEESENVVGSMRGGALGSVEDEGVLEWICQLDSGRSVDLVLAYDVSSPAGQRWETS